MNLLVLEIQSDKSRRNLNVAVPRQREPWRRSLLNQVTSESLPGPLLRIGPGALPEVRPPSSQTLDSEPGSASDRHMQLTPAIDVCGQW